MMIKMTLSKEFQTRGIIREVVSVQNIKHIIVSDVKRKITLPTSVLSQKENNAENAENQVILQTCVSQVQKLNQEKTYDTL